MKYLSKFIPFVIVAAIIFACDKTNDIPFYGAATNSVLTASTASIAAAPADSDKVALTLNWTNPHHATDSTNEKYVIEIDSTGKNFANEVTKVVTGGLSTTFTAKDLNTILVNRGYAFNVPVSLDVRLTSSYGNNNERLQSNTLKLIVTPYKVPPKVAVPSSGKLYLVGDATQGGWNNPVPVPSQEFEQIDATTWGGVFNLIGGKQYLILPVNGDWSHKYSVNDNTIGGLAAGGSFGYDLPQNFPGPATSGLYKIIVDFQAGKFTVTPYTGTLPTNLYLVGDATAGGWNNPVPTPSQQFTRLNSSQWQLTVPLIGGKQYLMLPVNGDWSHKFAVNDNTVNNLWKGGSFGYDLPQNFPGPPTSGTYTITADFLTNTFKVQ